MTAENTVPPTALALVAPDLLQSAPSMKPFVYQAPATRVIFGPGTLARLPDEVARLGAKRALVLCTPEQRASAERVAALLGERAAGIFDRAAMHVPIESAREARA
jgi:maleylacetate reductase